MRGRAAIGYVIFLSLVAGCATDGQDLSSARNPTAVQMQLSGGEEARHNAAAAAPTGGVDPAVTTNPDAQTFTPRTVTAAVPNEDYRVSPLDVIEVSIFQVPDLNRTVQVNASGLISLPLIGTITAGGKSVRELEDEITRLYGARYLQSPQVNVFIREYTSQRVTVDGAVNSPGVYQFAGKATLLQAIALARGLDRTADPSGIMVFRTIDGQRHGAVFDIGPIRKGAAPDPAIAGGDTIVVDQSAARTIWRDIRESIGVAGFFRPVIF